jgi:hypothetical protein
MTLAKTLLKTTDMIKLIDIGIIFIMLCTRLSQASNHDISKWFQKKDDQVWHDMSCNAFAGNHSTVICDHSVLSFIIMNLPNAQSRR